MPTRCSRPGVHRSREKELEDTISQLKATVSRKDHVIAEVTEEYVKLKKNLGKPEWRLDSP